MQSIKIVLILFSVFVSGLIRAQDRNDRSPDDLVSRLNSTVKEAEAMDVKAGIYAEIIDYEHSVDHEGEKNTDETKIIFAHAADRLFNIASVSKLITAAAALLFLGIDHAFQTEVYVKENPKDGSVKISLKGTGDPSLSFRDILTIAHDIKLQGIKKVSEIQIDGSAFDDDELPPAFDEKNTDDAFRSSVSAFSVEENAVTVTAVPGKKTGDPAKIIVHPPSDYLVVQNDSETVEKGKTTISIKTESWNKKTKIIVKGKILLKMKPVTVRKRIFHPLINAGYVIKEALEEMGIAVKDRISFGSIAEDKNKMSRIIVHYSQTIPLLLTAMVKNSSNFMAEQILKAAGGKVSGKSASFAAGIEAIRNFLLKDAVINESDFKIRNGSGLYDANFMKPAAMVNFLKKIYHNSDIANEFLSTMPVGGIDGTLKKRMKSECLKGRVRAKTGTLDNVIALAGFMNTKGKKVVAFSLFFESDKIKGKRKKLLLAQEKILQTVCEEL
jgi:D-alanyl-D-alanine carboxypeptidase/D-alanyl-D-alanine-endopeptidase (penicillin-binding protein 4)